MAEIRIWRRTPAAGDPAARIFADRRCGNASDSSGGRLRQTQSTFTAVRVAFGLRKLMRLSVNYSVFAVGFEIFYDYYFMNVISF